VREFEVTAGMVFYIHAQNEEDAKALLDAWVDVHRGSRDSGKYLGSDVEGFISMFGRGRFKVKAHGELNPPVT
jgi:hypothetical protein